jgi:hypothetical protein
MADDDQGEDMSETQEAPAAPVVDEGPVMVFDEFARTLRPRGVQVPNTARPGALMLRVMPGEPDEVWLKLLKIRSGKKKLTLAGWKAEIRKLHEEPAWRG